MPLWLALTGLGLLAFSFVLAEWRAGNLEAELRERFVIHAMHVAQALPVPEFAALDFGAPERDPEAYGRIGARLADMARLSGYGAIWILARRDGQDRFGPGSWNAGARPGVPPHRVRSGPPRETAAAFASGQPLVSRVHQTDAGLTVTALAPLIAPDGGNQRILVGIDIPAAAWSLPLYRTRLLPVLIGVTLCTLFFSASRLMRARRNRPDGLKWRHRHLETLLTAATGLLLTCDIAVMAARIEAREVSDAFERLAMLHVQEMESAWQALADPERAHESLTAAFARFPLDPWRIRVRLLAPDGTDEMAQGPTGSGFGVSGAESPPEARKSSDFDPRALRLLLPFFVPGGGVHAIVAEATPEFRAEHRRHLTWMTAFIGLLVTGVATFFVALQRGGQLRLESEASDSAARLQRQEANLGAIANAARDAILMMNGQGEIIYWNPAAERILGYRREEALDRDLHRLIAPPGDYEEYLRHLPEFQRLGKGDAIGRTLEMAAIRQDGQEIPIELSLSSLELDGQWYAVGILRDISDRKRAERRLRRLNECLAELGSDYADNIARIVAVCGELLEADCALYNRLQDGRLLTLGQWRAPDDLPLQDNPEGHVCHDLIQSSAAAQARAELEHETTRNLTQRTDSDILCIGRLEETPYFDSDPNVRKYGLRSYFGHAVRCAGQPVGSLCALFRREAEPDREDRRLLGILASALSAEENRHLALTQAERASQVKSEFLSSMSHELRTPMNAVLGFAQLLDQDPALGDEQRENVQEILRGGGHLLELINDVLDLAQVESGQLRLLPEPFPLDEAIEESLTLIRPLASARGIRVEGDEAGPFFVFADRGRVRQILINLLSNAVKYNRPDGWIRLSRERVEMPPRIRVLVEDSGIGIAQEDLERLFDPFTRLHEDTALAIEGTGIGLAVTRRLAHLMGGELGVESQLGEGSIFWFELPEADAETDTERARSWSAPRPDPVPTDGAAPSVPRPERTVLHIDDQAANLRLVAGVLTQRPWIRVLSASHPHLGLELAAAHRPDLILLDLQMPQMSGHEVFERLRRQPATARIPVIALTAQATRRDLERGARTGFDAYLTKPLNMIEFLETIDRWLERPTAHRVHDAAAPLPAKPSTNPAAPE